MNIPLNQLLGYANRQNFDFAINARIWDATQIPFADTTGFHLYCDLDMELRLSAGDEEAAAKNLKILQAYARAADAVCEPAWLRILEVQGSRMHLYAECRFPQKQDVEKLINSCEIIYKIATREIAKLAGNTTFGIRMAADHGRAILLRSTGEDVSESIVSLGNPANRPAKHLAREVSRNGVPSGHLALNVRALDPTSLEEWHHHDLRVETVTKSANESTNKSLILANSRFDEMVNFAAASEFEENPQNPVVAPIRRKGFMLRADLDGFTRRVEDAMNKGDAAIIQLVRDFQEIMKYPVPFKETLPKGVTVLLFPWAGDCANLFLECENYRLERTALPNSAAINWHSPKKNGRDWTSLLDKTQWLVAIAGGDEGEDHGMILTGNVVADKRTFHVGAGWSWKRSLDAEQADGNRPGDTVIQNEDYAGLDSAYKTPYGDHPEHPTLFKRASKNALTENAEKQKVTATVSAPAIIIGTRLAPPPRPYYSNKKR